MLMTGLLPSVKGTLYQATARVVFSYASFVNTDSSSRTINIYIKMGNYDSRRIIPKDFSLNPGEHADWTGKFELEVGDLIEGDASTGGVVDYTLN